MLPLPLTLFALSVTPLVDETLWVEAEHLHGVRGSCFPDMDVKTDGHWALSGPGIAPEWTQGGESEWLSIACAPDDDTASATIELEVPDGGDWTLWVRYRDWRKETELFSIRIDQPRMIVTSVEEFGLFCQGEDVPADGLLHVRHLPQDFYTLDRTTLTLSGRKQGNQFRLGVRLMCVIHRVDVAGRMLDLRFAAPQPVDSQPRSAKSLLAAIPGSKPKRSAKPRIPKKGVKKPAKRKRRR